MPLQTTVANTFSDNRQSMPLQTIVALKVKIYKQPTVNAFSDDCGVEGYSIYKRRTFNAFADDCGDDKYFLLNQPTVNAFVDDCGE